MVNAIINGNWDKLNEIFDPATVLANDRFKLVAMGLLKLDDAALVALADGKVLRWNNTDQKVEAVDNLTLAHLTLTNRLVLPSYTVIELEGDPGPPTASILPAATYPRAVVWCSNGDAGSPCLAVSNGTNWLRIALGATVAS